MNKSTFRQPITCHYPANPSNSQHYSAELEAWKLIHNWCLIINLIWNNRYLCIGNHSDPEAWWATGSTQALEKCLNWNVWQHTQNSPHATTADHWPNVADRTAGWWGVVHMHPPRISPSFPQDTSHCPWDVPSEGPGGISMTTARSGVCSLSVEVTVLTHETSALSHTHTPRLWGEHGKTKCPPWHAADWSCLTGASVCTSVLTWDWLYPNAKERSFIFNRSRGLPITGSAGWLWDDLIPALRWAEVVLRSSDFWC